jgi:dihydrofolate reductase
MRKIRFSIPITLDGYIEGPNHDLDWVIADDELHDFYADLLENADLMLYGRVTYQLMQSYWPNALSDPHATPAMLRFASVLNPMRKMVFSSTLKETDWNTQLVPAVNIDEIHRLKNQPGADILLGGGASLAQQFIQQGLVDEYQLVVMPVAIGRGTALFQGVSGQPKMALQWSQAMKSGAVVLCYHPDGKLLPGAG